MVTIIGFWLATQAPLTANAATSSTGAKAWGKNETILVSPQTSDRVSAWMEKVRLWIVQSLAIFPPPPVVHIAMDNVNTHDVLTIDVPVTGNVSMSVQKQVRQFLACRRTGKSQPIPSQLLALVANVAEHFAGNTLEVVSGVRGRPYGVKHSKHFTGHAIDFRVRGVPLKVVRDYLWSIQGDIGVGYYVEEEFVHLDYRPGEAKVAWEQKRPGQPNRYNPRWSQRLTATR